MPFRVTDATVNARLKNQISTARQRISSSQEQLASGKKLNRPSDNPTDANAVIRLRTSQAELQQFGRNASAVKDSLLTSDATLDSYQQLLDRAQAILTSAASDTFVTQAGPAVAVEVDGLTDRIRQVANTSNGDGYVFGGSRVTAPPFDVNGVLATPVATENTVQVEPEGTLVSTGVVAEDIFADASGNVLDTLKSASAAIKGTGNPAADRATILSALDRIKSFSGLSNVARTKVGERLNHLDEVSSRLDQTNLSVAATVDRLESVDTAAAALDLTQSNTALEAILQSVSKTGQRNLLDLLG